MSLALDRYKIQEKSYCKRQYVCRHMYVCGECVRMHGENATCLNTALEVLPGDVREICLDLEIWKRIV
jgi:hypothetical protein